MMKWGDLTEKEVISCKDGSRLGFVGDMVFDECTGRISSLLVPMPGKLCGLIANSESYLIEWSEIERIGEDIILVNKVIAPPKRERKNK